MSISRALCASACILSISFALPPLAGAYGSERDGPDRRELARGREIIPTNDGWASVPTDALPQGTTGGSAAAPERTVVVTSRNELVAALAYPDPTPKLIYVQGTIDANVDDTGAPLTCESYYRPDPTTGELYSPEAFLAAFDPAGPWGRVNPSGPQERARAASAAAQSARVRIRIPANTTIYGIGRRPTVRGAWFDIRPQSSSGNTPMNVIVRNIHFEDAADCFPVWAPNDGAQGNWNAAYDAISVRNSTHVWIDHNRFADVRTADETLPVLFGRLYQVHDGHVDITNESDYVTVSWNQLLHHDKVMLIGSSDGAVADRGKLRVTLHHNLFAELGQRVPRVRFGQVHDYNNLYLLPGATNYGYSWGVGIESQLYAENNAFVLGEDIDPAEIIDRFNGTRMTDTGNCVFQRLRCVPTDFVAAWNAANDPDILNDAGWTPTLYGRRGRAAPPTVATAEVLVGSGPSGVLGR
jgi:pectate lyase